MAKKLLPFSRHSIGALVALSLVVCAKLYLVSSSPDLSINTDYRLETIYFAATALICGAWMFSDRRRLGESLVSVGPTLAAIFWPIGIPIYLFYTRRWFGISKVVVAVIFLASFAVLGGYLGRSSLQISETEQAGDLKPEHALS